MSKALGVLSIDLVAKTGNFITGMDKAERSLDKFQKESKASKAKIVANFKNVAMAAGAMAAAIAGTTAKIVKDQMNLIDETNKMAKSLNSSYNSMKALELVASDSGVSLGVLTQVSKKLTLELSKAQNGNTASAETFKKLGLEAGKLAKLPIDKKIQEVNKALEKNVKASERASISNELFGKNAALTMSRMNSKDIEEASEKIEKYGLAMSDLDANRIEEANQRFSDLKTAIQGVFTQITVKLAPVFGEIFNLIKDMILENETLWKGIEIGGNIARVVITELVGAFINIKNVFLIIKDIVLIPFELLVHSIAQQIYSITNMLAKLPFQKLKDINSGAKAFRDNTYEGVKDRVRGVGRGVNKLFDERDTGYVMRRNMEVQKETNHVQNEILEETKKQTKTIEKQTQEVIKNGGISDLTKILRDGIKGYTQEDIVKSLLGNFDLEHIDFGAFIKKNIELFKKQEKFPKDSADAYNLINERDLLEIKSFNYLEFFVELKEQEKEIFNKLLETYQTDKKPLMNHINSNFEKLSEEQQNQEIKKFDNLLESVNTYRNMMSINDFENSESVQPSQEILDDYSTFMELISKNSKEFEKTLVEASKDKKFQNNLEVLSRSIEHITSFNEDLKKLSPMEKDLQELDSINWDLMGKNPNALTKEQMIEKIKDMYARQAMQERKEIYAKYLPNYQQKEYQKYLDNLRPTYFSKDNSLDYKSSIFKEYADIRREDFEKDNDFSLVRVEDAHRTLEKLEKASEKQFKIFQDIIQLNIDEDTKKIDEFIAIYEEKMSIGEIKWITQDIEKSKKRWLEEKKALENEYEKKKEEFKQEYKEIALSERLAELDPFSSLFTGAEESFKSMYELYGEFIGETNSFYKTLFAISKGFAIAEATVKIQEAIAIAQANPWPLNLTAIATAITQGAGILATIKGTFWDGMAHDGIDKIPETGTWLLEKGERVVTENTSKKLDNTLDNIENGNSILAVPVVNLYEDSTKAGRVEHRQENNKSIIDIFVSDLLGDGKTAKALNRKYSLNTIGR